MNNIFLGLYIYVSLISRMLSTVTPKNVPNNWQLTLKPYGVEFLAVELLH